MNKYEEAMISEDDTIWDFCKKYKQSPREALQELVDKSVPKKAERIKTAKGFTRVVCPCCKKDYMVWIAIDYKHCPNCGQALDWSVE